LVYLKQQERLASAQVLPGGVVRVIAGKPGRELNTPLDVAVAPNGRIFVADAGNGRVQVFSRWGRQKGFLGGEEISFTYPNTVAVDAYGQVYVGEFNAGQIRVFSPKGELLRTFDSRTAGVSLAPLDLAVDAAGRVFVADRQGAICVLDKKGLLRQRFDRIEGASPDTLSYPNGIAVDAAGNILVADSGNQRVLLLSAKGKLLKEIQGGGMTHPRGVGFFGEDYIVAADTFNHQLLVFDRQGKMVKKVRVNNQPGLAEMMPHGLCIYKGQVYVADRAHHIVVVFGKELKQ
jgi:DNA-binding beta-propeller fold protein YncE